VDRLTEIDGYELVSHSRQAGSTPCGDPSIHRLACVTIQTKRSPGRHAAPPACTSFGVLPAPARQR
jgi:hypothetical protein